MSTYDVAVIGLGAMGSATAAHAARRGLSVVGFDRFTPPHDQGSTHGRSRIIRQAYHENPAYVPMIRRAFELWEDLEGETGRDLLRVTGGINIGTESHGTFTGARQSAQTHGLPHDVLDAAAIRERFPGFRPEADMHAVWEARAGSLDPEACVEAYLWAADRDGADLRFNSPVDEWTADESGVTITSRGTSIRADRLILTAGPWLPHLLGDLALPLRVERQVFYWFQPKEPVLFEPGRFPVFILEYDDGRSVYGLPDFGPGFKIGIHHEGATVTPETVDRNVHADEIVEIRSLVRRFMPRAEGALLDAKVCLYTDTPDYTFILDRHPRRDNVVIGSPCSGHGFKFASAVGEILVDLAIDGRTEYDLSLFRAARWLEE